jgi:3-hydroxybutyryl-CoA dehydrogenase
MGPLELLDLTGLDVSVPVMESIHTQYYGDDRYRPSALARTRLVAGLLGRKSGQGFYRYDGASAAPQAAAAAAPASPLQSSFWWPTEGPGALPDVIASLLPSVKREPDVSRADVILVAPLDKDLSSTLADMALDRSRTLAIDPLFASAAGVTLMTSPATAARTVEAAQAAFADAGVPSFVIADSPGYVAARVVACIVNLACEMAQQGIAPPADIDVAMRLGLGYPAGPFEWGDRLGAARVLQVMEALYATFRDPRYRPSPWLVRRARLALPLATPDRQG